MYLLVKTVWTRHILLVVNTYNGEVNSMFLNNMILHNFRCFEDFKIEFHPNLTVIVGSNGAGKTSILEGAAIAMSSLFVKMDDLKGRNIEKAQVHLKSFSPEAQKIYRDNILLKYQLLLIFLIMIFLGKGV